MSWKNLFFRAVTACRISKHQQQDPQRPRILLVSTTALGDALLLTPTIRAIKNQFPQSYLAILTGLIGEQIFRHNPYVDDIFINVNSTFITSIKWFLSIRKKKIEIALISRVSQRAVLPLVFLSGPTTIVGYLGCHKGSDHLLTHPLQNQPIHAIEQNLKIAEVIGVQPNDYHMNLFLTKHEAQSADHVLPDYPFLVGMQPGARNKFKQWLPNHFITLGRRLVKEKNAKIIIFGSPEEAKLVHFITDNIPGAVSLAALPIRIKAAIIKKLDLFITNDTGPMHIAFAMNTATIALFAPTDSKISGPYKASKATVIQKPRTCTPCIERRCQNPFCMDQIVPEEVWKIIQEM